MQYKFAENDGSIVVEEYDESTRPSQEAVKSILMDAFHINGQPATIEMILEEVYKVTCGENENEQTVYVSAKPTAPGGRPSINDEQRIQQLPCYLNAAADQKDAGNKAITVGVYRRNEGVIICAWKVTHSNAADGNRVSKQIKIDTIAKAMREGFAQQKMRGQDEYVCAFRKEFLYFYLRNMDWLHSVGLAAVWGNLGEREEERLQEISFATGCKSSFSRNRILFGAPGTGKSYTLNKEREQLLGENNETDYERVTFHPDYSYANFVGTYKPISDDEGAISYQYVPGPFLRLLVKALKNSRTSNARPFLLIIEEINRANVTAVFGDVFQLLDRDDSEISEYPIQTSEEMRKHLERELGGAAGSYDTIRIPDNMFIWATMNSADQGVFPVDTAFKRRWDFTYLGIDDSESGISELRVVIGTGEYRRCVGWNALRKAINEELLLYKVNEDKLLGPHFVSTKNLPHDQHGLIDPKVFSAVFKNKVLMYLFDDAAKQRRPSLFGGTDERIKSQYSKLCNAFDEKGVFVFCDSISRQFIDVPTDADAQAGV